MNGPELLSFVMRAKNRKLILALLEKGPKIPAQIMKETGMYKSQSEVVRDAIRELAYKYKIDAAPSIEEVRNILGRAAKKSGKSLSQTVREIRDEA